MGNYYRLLGIEGIRAYITTDSVKILDKQNKNYIARSVPICRKYQNCRLTWHPCRIS